MSSAADRVVDFLIDNGTIGTNEDLVALNRAIEMAIEQRPFIELHPAHSWDCERCGRENFSRCVTVSHQDTPQGPAEHGMWLTAPTMVICCHCGAEYLVREDWEDITP